MNQRELDECRSRCEIVEAVNSATYLQHRRVITPTEHGRPVDNRVVAHDLLH